MGRIESQKLHEGRMIGLKAEYQAILKSGKEHSDMVDRNHKKFMDTHLERQTHYIITVTWAALGLLEQCERMHHQKKAYIGLHEPQWLLAETELNRMCADLQQRLRSRGIS